MEAATVQHPPPQSYSAQILIVEDHYHMRHMLETWVRHLGMTFVSVDTGDKGLSTAINQDFDLLIVDYSLPRLNGAELIRRVVAAKPATRALLFTADSEQEVTRLVQVSGAIGFLTKPTNLTHFERAIREALRT